MQKLLENYLKNATLDNAIKVLVYDRKHIMMATPLMLSDAMKLVRIAAIKHADTGHAPAVTAWST